MGGTKSGRLGFANGDFVFVRNGNGGVEGQIGEVVDANLKNVVKVCLASWSCFADAKVIKYFCCFAGRVRLSRLKSSRGREKKLPAARAEDWRVLSFRICTYVKHVSSLRLLTCVLIL